MGASGLGAWAWSGPAGSGVRATGVGRPAAGARAPVRQPRPRWPSGLRPRRPCGGGPRPGVAPWVTGPWASALHRRKRPPRPPEVSGGSPRPSPAVADQVRHAAAAPAPPLLRCRALGAAAGRRRHAARARRAGHRGGRPGAGAPGGPAGRWRGSGGRHAPPDDGREARGSRLPPTGASPRPVPAPRAPRR
jgi:translation initiation factor IF-2